MAGGSVTLPSDKVAAELARVYEVVGKRIDAEILEALEKGEDAAALQKRRARIAALLAIARKRSRPLIIRIATEGYRDGSVFMADRMIKQARRRGRFLVELGPRDRQAQRVLAEAAVSKFSEMEVGIGRRVDDALRQVSLQTISEAVAAGDTRVEASKTLEGALERAGITRVKEGLRIVPINGRHYRVGPYAEMVARTTSREAASLGMANRLRANGRDLVTIDSHGTSCDICGKYEGNTYSLDGATEGYPVLDQMPPFHPRCRHVLTPAALP